MKIITIILALALAGCGGSNFDTKPDGSGTVETTTIGPAGSGSITPR